MIAGIHSQALSEIPALNRFTHWLPNGLPADLNDTELRYFTEFVDSINLEVLL